MARRSGERFWRWSSPTEHEVLFFVEDDNCGSDGLTIAAMESKYATEVCRQCGVVITWVRGTSDA